MKTIYLVINTQFTATHHWAVCDPEHSQNYLRYPHRHTFHITMKWIVGHVHREFEFIERKNEIDLYLRDRFVDDDISLETPSIGSRSCEQLADELLEAFPDAVYCSVFEDGENGAEIYRTFESKNVQVA